MAEVVIIGKPNVGKSTLFNRLVKRRKSIVDDVPGVTRDIVRDVVKIDNGSFYLVDTGGIFEKPPGDLEEKVREKVLAKIKSADLILFLVDGRKNPTSEDHHIADFLRKFSSKVLLVATKVENEEAFLEVLPDIYSLGFGEPIPISAEHKRNIDVLLDKILEKLGELGADMSTGFSQDDAIKVAILGKPNAGKSSIFNMILGQDRAIVTSIPGTTRDSIEELVEIDGKKYLFVDTAGLRRKSRIEKGSLEKYGSYRSVDALESSDVAVLVIDSTEGITRQDQRLAGLAERKGKSTVVVFNKIDLLDARREDMKKLEDEFMEKLYFIDYSPVVFTSASEGWGIEDLIRSIDKSYKSYTTKVSTSRLNKALEKFLLVSPPPSKKGKKIRIYFGMQVDIKPPVFLFFSNKPEDIPRSYVKSLQRMIRDEVYHFTGAPIFIRFKRSKR